VGLLSSLDNEPHPRACNLAVIRGDAVWVAPEVSDIRKGIDVMLASPCLRVGNRRAGRLKVPVCDCVGMWLCARRMQPTGFAWLGEDCGGLDDGAVRLADGKPALAAPEHVAGQIDHGDLSRAF
jgi:hypothetical protein